MLLLAAFLGNTGTRYKGTRHNVGWHLAERLPFYKELPWCKKFKGLWAQIERKTLLDTTNIESPDNIDSSFINPVFIEDKISFVLPGNYMNRSGESVFGAASFLKIKPEKIIVVHDELELPLGTISLKFSGGLGGHNGLRSMKASFNTADFWRLRIGIGRPDSRLPGEGGREGSGEGIVDWVLSDFYNEEKPLLESALDAAAELLIKAFLFGPEKFLLAYSKKKIIQEQ